MPRANMDAMLKRRMSATQQASELDVGDDAYKAIFKEEAPVKSNRDELPIDKLRPFFTTDIGFHPYPAEKLTAFAQELAEEGLFERIIVRPIPDTDSYEILSGHNRTEAAKLAGWTTIPAEIVEADDGRAVTIATATNLLRRQGLTIIERGKAYQALLMAKNRNGKRNAFDDETTFGEVRQRYNAREIVAQFFGVTEYEIRKAIHLSSLIPSLQRIIEEKPKQLKLACAEMIADYDPEIQEAFVELCSIDGYSLSVKTMKHIISTCPPPKADKQALFSAWREGRSIEERQARLGPRKISFDRKLFAPYIQKAGSEKKLEDMVLEFLKNRFDKE